MFLFQAPRSLSMNLTGCEDSFLRRGTAPDHPANYTNPPNPTTINIYQPMTHPYQYCLASPCPHPSKSPSRSPTPPTVTTTEARMAVGLARATRRLRRTDQHLVAHRQRRSAHGAHRWRRWHAPVEVVFGLVEPKRQGTGEG